ncbi:MAG: hypothetical protein IPH93_00725 [Saprospiraceae bacterium]|nr:hypothetical protein [Saprospiraceae bacterium]MBK7810035.1 hypothetical protein [Saprospiraceae bacterium]MBK9629636.1 hypothetical protein [Saprospiraceae bacterium]
MDRRKFIKKSALAAAGTIGVPYLLPSGLLFARQSSMKAQHVVFVQFAGGLRHQESVLQLYLSGSQTEKVEGNIMYNLLDGKPPEDKIAYGTDDKQNNIVGAFPINPILQTPLQRQGVLFPEVRFSKGGAGHFNGLSTGVSGNYYTTAGLRQRTASPTIFEYMRKHAGFKATDCWSIGQSIIGSRPLLNYSAHEDYGRRYGGNFIAPTITFGEPGQQHFMDFKNYHPDTDYGMIREVRGFLNKNFATQGLEIPHLYNTPEEENSIREFVRVTFEKVKEGRLTLPPVNDNGDLKTLGYAVEVLRWFKPKVSVVDLSAIDVCHGNFTGYLKNVHRADHGIAFLWKEIQSIPGMKDNTIMIVMPEHGRDLEPNSIKDLNDWVSFDHSGSPNARRMFTLMVGPGVDANLKVGSETNPVGDAADIVPTIADIFGLKDKVYSAGLLDGNARSLFDRM